MLLAMVVMAGCHPHQEPSPESVSVVAATDAPWLQQIDQVRSGMSDRIELTETPIRDEQLHLLHELGSLRVLILDAGEITDEGTEVLAQLPQLSQLRLRESPLTDAGFEQLAKSLSLELINVPQAVCTAAGVEALARLPHLKQLRIASPNLSGKGTAEALCKLKGLRSLHLIDVPIEDDDLQKLATLEHLNSLYVDGSRVTDAGWGAFYQVRPDVHVHVDQKHKDFDPRQD